MPSKTVPIKTTTHQIGELSESLEDYLEIIFQLQQERHMARVKEIAAAKKVKMSSVTSALRRLNRLGLIEYEAREIARLSKTGESLAQRLWKRHHFLTDFLIDVLKLDRPTADKDACAMEHALSQKTMTRLSDFAEYLQTSKNGAGELIRKFRPR